MEKDKFQALEDQIRQELAADGIELLLPIAPDLFLSDDESDPKTTTSSTTNSTQWTIDSLRQQYQDAFEIMKTSTLNNHHDRNLFKESTLFQDLRQKLSSPFSKPIETIAVRSITREEFHETYVKGTGTPVLISGIPEEENWNANERWSSVDRFIELYGDIPIKVMEKHTSHGMGRAFIVRIPIALYYDYAMNNNADDPFYGFEPDFTEKRRQLLLDYATPCFFKDDFYNLNDRTREFYPNYRHFIIGGERTGTNLHVDPKCTGAWNTLLSGHKKWVLFPPGTDQAYLDMLQVDKYSKKPSTYWWQDVISKLPQDSGIMECIQNPGETIFVPAGWWHAVLNLDFTIAITENLLIPSTLPTVWGTLKSTWTKFTDFLEQTEPELVGHLSSITTTPQQPPISSYY